MTSHDQISRRCPSCGKEVVLSLSDLHGWTAVDPYDLMARGPETDPPGIGRVVRALCGCYVFEMPESAVGRLLASVLAANDEEPGDDQGG